jgi:hypothetical protein
MHHQCIEVYLRIVGKVVLEDMLNIRGVKSVSVGGTSRQIHTWWKLSANMAPTSHCSGGSSTKPPQGSPAEAI